MLTGRISGATRTLGAPRDWDADKQGPCGGLAIRDTETASGHAMVSAWFPTTAEIERLKEGAPLYLTVVGMVHPPVALSVGFPSE